MCVIQSWPQLSHLTLPAGVRVSSVIFRQVGSNRQFSRLKMVTDNCLQLYFVNFQRMELKYYANSHSAIRRHSNLIVAQRGITVMTNYMIHWPQWICKRIFSLWVRRSIANFHTCLKQYAFTSVRVSAYFERLNTVKYLLHGTNSLHLEDVTSRTLYQSNKIY